MYPEKKPELYGGDAFLLGQSAGEEQFKKAMGTLAPPQLQPGVKSQEGAEGQLWQGIGQQQQLGQSMASRRGYNPLAARAATSSGAEMESQGFGAAQGIRAGEEAQRRAQQLQAFQARSAYDQAMAQLGQQQFGSSLERQLYEDAMARGLFETQRQKDRAEQEGYMNAISGGVQLASQAIGAIASDPSMKAGIGSGNADVDRAMALFNPTGAKPSGGIGGALGNALSGGAGLLKSLTGGKSAQIPGAGGVPIKDAELFNWSAQQSGQSVDPNMLKAAMAGGGTLPSMPGGGGLDIAGIGGQLGGILGGIFSDPDTKQGMVDGSENVDEALALLGGADQIRQIYGERGEQPIGNAILEETGEYDNAANPRTATMYLGDMARPAAIVQAPGVQNEIAALSKQFGEMTPFEQMIALNRGKAVPASERLASAGEAIGAASVAADPRLRQVIEPLGSFQQTGIAMQDIGEGGPANAITYGTATPKAQPMAVPQRPMLTVMPPVVLRDTPYTAAQRNAPKFAEALKSFDASMQQGLARGGVAMPASFASQLLEVEKKKRERELANQMLAKAEQTRQEVVDAPTADEIIKAGEAEMMDAAERSLMETGTVDTDAILNAPMPTVTKRQVDEFQNGIRPVSFSYKPEARAKAGKLGVAAPAGRQTGILTTDLMKSPLGRSAVIKTPAGDAMDAAKAVSLSLAANARNNERINQLEQKIKKGSK